MAPLTFDRPAPVEDVLEVQAQRWMDSMRKLHEPLGRMADTPGESAALALHAGLSTAWAPGGRLDLIRGATRRLAPSHAAFVTLALKTWPCDLRVFEHEWLLPCQLAWSWAGLDLSNGGLPAGVEPSDLPMSSEEKARAARVRRLLRGEG